MNPLTTVLPTGHVQVSLSGELDIATAPAARDALDQAAGQAVTGLIIDLAEVTFLDAAGLGVLVGASKRARRLPEGLRLAAVPAHVLRLLQVTGLDRDLACDQVTPPSWRNGAGSNGNHDADRRGGQQREHDTAAQRQQQDKGAG